jgi:hypothetical protein
MKLFVFGFIGFDGRARHACIAGSQGSESGEPFGFCVEADHEFPFRSRIEFDEKKTVHVNVLTHQNRKGEEVIPLRPFM